MPTTKSYIKNGHAYFKNAGGYYEVTTSAKNGVNNDAPSAKNQKNLAPKGNKTAGAKTLKNVWKELGW